MKVLSLKCVNCGASLEIGPEVEHFACSYCGVQQVVQRSGGIVSLRRLEATLREVKHGTDRTASELALQRLLAEVARIEAERDAAIEKLIARDESGNGTIGLVAIVGAAISVWAFAQYGWLVLPFVAITAYLGYKLIPTVSGPVADIRKQAAEKMAPLKEKIAHHRAVVDKLAAD